MSTLLKMQKFHPLCSRCIGMYPLQNRWTVLRYLQCYENFSECCTHLILPETALFSPTPTFAKEPEYVLRSSLLYLGNPSGTADPLYQQAGKKGRPLSDRDAGDQQHDVSRSVLQHGTPVFPVSAGIRSRDEVSVYQEGKTFKR